MNLYDFDTACPEHDATCLITSAEVIEEPENAKTLFRWRETHQRVGPSHMDFARIFFLGDPM